MGNISAVRSPKNFTSFLRSLWAILSRTFQKGPTSDALRLFALTGKKPIKLSS